MSHLHVSFHTWCLICTFLFTHDVSFARFFSHMMSHLLSSTFVLSYSHVSSTHDVSFTCLFHTWELIRTFLFTYDVSFARFFYICRLVISTRFLHMMSHSHVSFARDVSFACFFNIRLIPFTCSFTCLFSTWCLTHTFLLHIMSQSHISSFTCFFSHIMSHSHVSSTHDVSLTRSCLHLMSHSHVHFTHDVSFARFFYIRLIKFTRFFYIRCISFTRVFLHFMSHSHVLLHMMSHPRISSYIRGSLL